MARIAVPVFFMITGYFYSSICKSGRQTSQIKKILSIAIFSNLLYLLWALLTDFLSTGSVAVTIRSWLDVRVWLRFLFINESPFRSHLWYLSALLYVLAIVHGLDKISIHTYHLYPLIPVLLCINLVLGNYSLLIFGTNIELALSRNYLFMGLPCFLLGDRLFRNGRFGQLRNAQLWLIFFFSVLLTQCERIFLLRNGTFENSDFFIGTIFTAYAVFLLVKNNPGCFQNKVSLAIAWMGRELSLGLYIFNAIVRTVVLKGIELISGMVPVIGQFSYHTMPIIMLCATSCATFLLVYLQRNIRNRSKIRN